jgi:hypothetical protein
MLAALGLMYDNSVMTKSWPAMLLISFGIVFILLALGYAVYQQRISQINPAPLPEELAGLPLRDKNFGSPALTELSWMHGQEFQLNQGAVGIYGSSGEITLYVAGTPLSFMAGRMISDMRDKIAGADTPFTPVAERDYGLRTVYELVGMGQQHYYFRSGNLVIWLAVHEQDAELAFQQALEFYP